ncbi:MAG: chitobiase/beta-hexosaminidase C-terminal domain-containing protein [Lachnospiraceae bacterium]|nr:chitobiase/beta-hexosaminidase C-terminal domain-containing protein [Lachnospiraceae bacterium]MCM1239957.1 chitobiase/beta-hexosaminidase C-terminal domain-containing protein [Lachnospiraceae bacterium]
MANFGLSHPWIAEYLAPGKYGESFRCGEAVSTSVSPTYNEAKLYGDNRQVETIKEFKEAAVTLGATRLPLAAGGIMFGHTMDSDGAETSNTEDSTGYVGYGFITAEMEDKKKIYRACFLPMVKFSESEEAYETKGDSIVLKTPVLNGTAIGDADGIWRRKSPRFGSEKAADEWIRLQIGTVEQCAMPMASVPGGVYGSAQSVALSTSTAGATIRYTTDGTTPSETNGQVYSEAVSISGNTGLRAIACKDGARTSDMLLEEYFVTGDLEE